MSLSVAHASFVNNDYYPPVCLIANPILMSALSVAARSRLAATLILMAARHTGHGLLGMRERAAAAGGVLHTGEAPGGGFRIAAELPAKALDTMTSAPVGARE